MKYRSNLVLIAALAGVSLVLGLAACKKAEPPAPVPEPKAAAESTDTGPGQTTTYESPAPEPTAPPAQPPSQ